MGQNLSLDFDCVEFSVLCMSFILDFLMWGFLVLDMLIVVLKPFFVRLIATPGRHFIHFKRSINVGYFFPLKFYAPRVSLYRPRTLFANSVSS